jgi:hypothetical protein
LMSSKNHTRTHRALFHGFPLFQISFKTNEQIKKLHIFPNFSRLPQLFLNLINFLPSLIALKSQPNTIPPKVFLP